MFIISILLFIIIMIIVFFKLPYSKTKSKFNRLMSNKVSETKPDNTVFTEEDIKNLPVPVQKFFRYCGYIGTPKMA